MTVKFTVVMCGKHLASLVNDGDKRVIDVEYASERDCEYSEKCVRNSNTTDSSERFKVVFQVVSLRGEDV